MSYYLEFDGVNDYVSFPRISLGESGSENFKIVMNLASYSSGFHRILGAFNSFSAYFILNLNTADVFSFRMGNGSQQNYTVPGINDGFPHEVIVESISGDGVRVYYDGVEVGSVYTDNNSIDVDRIGYYGSESDFFNGAIYGVEIFVGGVRERFYNPANTSSGLTLLDDESAQDGTLVNFPGDNGQWVFYSAAGSTSFIEALTPNTATTSIQTLSTVYGQSDILALTSSQSAVIALDQAVGHSDPLAPVLSNAQAQLLDIITGMVDISETLTTSSEGVALVLVSGVQDQLVAVMTPTVAASFGQQLQERIGQIQALQAEASEAVTVDLNLQAGSVVSLITALSAEIASSNLIPLGTKTGYSINAAPAEAVTGTLALTELTGQVITLEPSMATASGTNLQQLTGVIIGSFRRSSIIDMSTRYSTIDQTTSFTIEEV